MAITISGSTGITGVDGSASTPAVQGTDTNTGIYFPGADRIGFAEGGVQVGEFDASGNFQFNSGYGSVATAYGCRAWVNFNGTGVVAIRASGNVSSITDNGTGSYTLNFTNALPDANYSTVASSSGSAGYNLAGHRIEALATGSVRIINVGINGSTQVNADSGTVLVAVFR